MPRLRRAARISNSVVWGLMRLGVDARVRPRREGAHDKWFRAVAVAAVERNGKLSIRRSTHALSHGLRQRNGGRLRCLQGSNGMR